jgi:hypothetical protein
MNLRLLRVSGSREMHCVMAEEGILLMCPLMRAVSLLDKKADLLILVRGP